MSKNNNIDESFFAALDEELSSFVEDRARIGKIGALSIAKGSGTADDPFLGESSRYAMIADMAQIAEKLDKPVHFMYEGKGYVATRRGIMESDDFDALDELDEAKVTPGQTKEEHYGSWMLRFELRPVAGSKEYRGRAWHTKSDKTPPVSVTGSSADDVKTKLVATIDSTKSRKTIDPKSYVTIDFNVLTTKDIVGHKDAIYCDIEDVNGLPTLLIAAEQPGGFQIAADRTALAQQGEHRTGQHAFRLRGDKAAKAGLTHARYALGEPFDYTDGVTAFPLKFSSEVHPGEVIRLSEPGVTVAYPRNIAEVNEAGEFEGIFSKKEEDITEGIFHDVGLTEQQRDLIRKFFNHQGSNVDVKYSKDGDYVLTTALGHHNNTVFRFWNDNGKLKANIEYYRSRSDAGNIKQPPLTTIMDVEIRGPWQLEELMTKYGGLKEDAIVESESNLNYYEGTGNELYAEIKEIMHDLVHDFASFAVPTHTRPSAPDSTKFRAEISGVIEYATNVRIDGGKYGIPKSYKMFLKIGKAVKPEIRDNIRSEFERDIYALTAQSSVNPITTSDGYTFSFSNVEGGTAWGGIGVIITPPKASIAESNEGKAKIRSYKDRNGVTKYEVLNADGVRVKGDLSKEMADDYMRAHRSELQESAGSFRVNMAQMNRWKVDQDNIRYYDHIMKNKGKVQTLDTRPYIEYLNQFGIFYTGPKLTESEELSGYKMLGDLSKVNTDDLLAQLKIRTQLAATGKYDGPTLNRIQAGIGRIESALSGRGIKISESELTEDDFSIADMDPDYEEEEESNEFYVAIYNEDDNTTFIGKLVNEGRRWKELNVAGTPPYNWPCHGYMGYLTPSDVMSWIYKDYSRGYEVKGPFATRQAATQWAEHNFGPLGESTEGECKWEVSYDFYGSNTEVPLYSKSVIVRASSGDEAVALVKRLIGGRNHKAVPTELVAEAGKKGMSAHAKEMRKKSDEYYSQQVLNREKEQGETFHYGNAKVTRPPEKKVEESWSKNPSGTWTNNHTGRSYSQKGGGPDNGGNSSYMTPEYMLAHYKKRLADIEASPYKRTREVARLKSKIAKLEGPASVTEAADPQKKIASLEKQYDTLRGRLGMAKDRRRMKGDRLLSPAEQKIMSKMSEVQSQIYQLKADANKAPVEEAIKFSKGAYPDVDHMNGSVIRDWGDTPKKQVIPFKNRSAWETTAQKANSELYDDNAEIISMGVLREYEIDGKVFARWIETTSSGWVQTTPINESVVTEKSKSAKQARFMAAAAHDPKFAKKVGIKQSVAKEFNQADKGTTLLKKATSESEEVVEAGKKGMSAHAKEVAASRKKYELELDAARAKWERENGEKYHFGNAIVTKKGTNEIK